MKTIRTERQANDSHWFVINGRDYFLPWNWEIKVNLDNLTYLLPWGDDKAEWEASPLPTLNMLKAMGHNVEEGKPYKEYEIDFPAGYRELTPEKAHDIVDEFFAHGIPVTLDAIMHNYAAWKQDWKSGYRGEDFHLFTPCGCNPLSFRATTLHPSCENWQTTYMC